MPISREPVLLRTLASLIVCRSDGSAVSSRRQGVTVSYPSATGRTRPISLALDTNLFGRRLPAYKPA